MIESPNETVLVGVADGVCTVTMNRPAALNAIEHDMVAALADVTTQVREDDAVRAVVIRGAGDHFMAGGDLKTFKELIDAEPDKTAIRHDFESFVHGAHITVTNIRRMRKPVIASVRGSVAGFGLSLMLACDLAVAADDSVFTLAYSQIGISPDGGSTFALPRTVGLKRAFEIALLSDRFDAEAAREAGLVNRVVPVASLDGETSALARRLAHGPVHAYGNTKELLNASLDHTLEEQLAAEATSFGECAAREDFAEGLAAFIEKRAPVFTGK